MLTNDEQYEILAAKNPTAAREQDEKLCEQTDLQPEPKASSCLKGAVLVILLCAVLSGCGTETDHELAMRIRNASVHAEATASPTATATPEAIPTVIATPEADAKEPEIVQDEKTSQPEATPDAGQVAVQIVATPRPLIVDAVPTPIVVAEKLVAFPDYNASQNLREPSQLHPFLPCSLKLPAKTIFSYRFFGIDMTSSDPQWIQFGHENSESWSDARKASQSAYIFSRYPYLTHLKIVALASTDAVESTGYPRYCYSVLPN